MIILAILIPPLAVFLATKNPIRTLIALGLWILGWIPGSIYGVMVVNEKKTQKIVRASERRITDAMKRDT